jgi:6-phospho-beta-glucosidase
MKVAVLGGGGFRTPTLHGCLVRVADEAGISEIVLEDLDAGRLARIRAVIEGLDRERGGTALPVRTTTSLDDAVEGAGAVLAAIRVGGTRARVIDEEVPRSFGVLGQETVGPAGIAFALRTIPAMRAIGETVRDRAPGAWFVNFTNPAGIVTEVVRSVLGDRAVGICDSPAALCARVASALGRPADAISFDHAGLNHLGWLLAAEADGVDLLPGLLEDEERLAVVDEARLFGPDRLRGLGAIPDEYLVYLDRAGAVTRAFAADGPRGAIVEEQQRVFDEEAPADDPAAALAAWRRARDARHGTYLAEGWAAAAWDPPRAEGTTAGGPGEEGYAAVAADLLVAVRADTPRRLIVDTANAGRLDGLADDEVVEVTCEVSRSGVRPLPGRSLPASAAALVGRVKEVERLTIRAEAEGSAVLALEALRAHPVVPSTEVAERILGGYLERHGDLRTLLG